MFQRVKRPLAVALAVLGLIGATSPGSVNPNIYPLRNPRTALIRFRAQLSPEFAKRRAQVEWLHRAGFDIAGANMNRNQMDVIVTEGGLQLLQRQGVNGQIVGRHTPGTEAVSIDPRYLNPDRLAERLRALSTRFSKVTRLVEIGRSLQNRPIFALLISTTPDPKDPKYLTKPSILFDGMHHAREVMTAEVVLDVAETLLMSAARGVVRAREATSEWNIWVVPMLNVDGNNIVWTADKWWRKNARGDVRDGVFGVDINRNYPYRWSGCNGSSNVKGAQDYHGAGAASEPETQALVGLAEAVRPAASLSYHSYSELVLYPYGCQGEMTAEHQLVERVGKELAQKLPSDSTDGSSYRHGTPWSLLYPVDGDSMGFMHAAFGALAYTFEINQEFQPSYELREPTVRKQRVAWQYFLDRISRNLLSISVIDAKTGQAAVAQIGIDTIVHKKNERPFQTNGGGYYFKVLDPGKYIVSARLQDGRVAQVPVEMNGQPQTLTVTIR